MKIPIYDFLLICLGLSFGTYRIFIDDNHRVSNEFAGILSYILSLWICISCAKSLKGINKS